MDDGKVIDMERDCKDCGVPLWQHEGDLCYWCETGHVYTCLAPATGNCTCEEN